MLVAFVLLVEAVVSHLFAKCSAVNSQEFGRLYTVVVCALKDRSDYFGFKDG